MKCDQDDESSMGRAVEAGDAKPVGKILGPGVEHVGDEAGGRRVEDGGAHVQASVENGGSRHRLAADDHWHEPLPLRQEEFRRGWPRCGRGGLIMGGGRGRGGAEMGVTGGGEDASDADAPGRQSPGQGESRGDMPLLIVGENHHMRFLHYCRAKLSAVGDS
ncbi:hypothetical protein L7F22_051989 [Adiantum nelumboides]|nr:hypothetical protein [Adiantum nelumboides]